MQIPETIFELITTEETNFTLPIQVIGEWEWSMRDHIELTCLYKNSTYKTGKDDNKPFKNITRPILNLQYRAEGFDVKDIELYVDDAKNYYKSFLIKKYHEKWARDKDLDTFIDDMVESYVDFGGALIKKTSNAVPEVVPMQSIAFVDQTDILSGPICLKHFYSPDQLKEKAKVGWGNKENGANVTLDELITLSLEQKVQDKTIGQPIKTPGKYIEIYEIHGSMPENYLNPEMKFKEEYKYISQMQIIAFYTSQNAKGEMTKTGVTLYRTEEKESIFKLVLRDKIYGRALGLGGAEELFEAQVWVNYDIIRITEVLDSVAKIIFQTDDPAFATRNKLGNVENMEILNLAEGKKITQIDTFPRNFQLFNDSIVRWEQHAQQMGSAQDPIMGEAPKSGTPFALQELVTAESHSLHEYRKGKLATFLDEIYRDWIIPHISKEISKDQEFLAELDLEEMQEIAERVTENVAEDEIKRLILAGRMIDPAAISTLKETTKNLFMKGSKKFIKILAGEMEKAPLSVKVNIAGKQKNMPLMVQKLTNVFRQVLANPAVLQIPAMGKLFNSIIEASGLSPIDFSGIPKEQIASTQQQTPLTALNELTAPIGA